VSKKTQPFFNSGVEIKFYEGIYRVFELKTGVCSGKAEKLSKNRISGPGEACSDLLILFVFKLILAFTAQNQGLPYIRHLFA
jgi:hypothetical protein